MNIHLIVAVSDNDVIGRDNDLPWKLSNDLKYFKKITGHSPILMGRRTFESIGRVLPNRLNVVISRSKNILREEDHFLQFTSIPEALESLRKKKYKDIFIIGGGNIYAQTLPLADKVYLTRVHTEIKDGHTFFPRLKEEQWDKVSSEHHFKNDQNDYDHTFEIYKRIK